MAAFRLPPSSAFGHFIDGGRRRLELDDAAWTTLQTVSGPGRRLDPETEGRLSQALVEARAANRAIRALPGRLSEILQQTGLGDDFPQVNPRNAPLPSKSWSDICDPIRAAPPPIYGRLP